MHRRLSLVPAILVILLLVGGFLRFYNLGNIILYWDEPLHCIRIANQSFPFVIAHNDGSAFFTLLVHFLLPLGKTEVMARLPSAVFGLLAIIAVYFLGKAIFSKREGLMAAAFITFSPLLIRFSQYSRAYSTYVFLSILSLYFFLRAIKENQTKLWVFYCISTTIHIYNHIFALFAMPVYGIYAGIMWLKGRFGSTVKKKKEEADKLKKFILWTLLILILVSALYFPDVSIRSFISASLERAKDQPSDASASPSQIIEIFYKQLVPKNTCFFLIMLFSGLIGLISSIKKYSQEAIFSVLYMFLPFLIFILIKPNRPTYLSAGRYFVFILPLLFILISKGIVSIVTVIASIGSKIKPIILKKVAFRNILIGAIFIILIGWGFDHKDYYLNFWRFSTLKIKKEVSDFLRKNVKRDALIHFDSFPASSLVMATNPLTQNLRILELEMIIRYNQELTTDKNDIITYQINPRRLKILGQREVDLWVVTKLDPEWREKLHLLFDNQSQTEVMDLKEHTILYLKKNGEPLSQKLAQMAEAFLSLNFESAKEKEYRLLAARNYLFDERLEEALEELNKARNITLTPFEAKIEESPLVFRAFDRIFGLNDQELRQLNQDNLLSSIAQTLLFQGNRFRVQKEDQKACTAYIGCLNISQDYDEKIANGLSIIANRYFIEGKTKEAIDLYERALKLSPQRYDLNFLLAESYRKEGFNTEADEKYRKAFGLDSLPSRVRRKIANIDPLIIVWKKNNTWHLIFRSEKGCTFSGKIKAAKKIKSIKKYQFIKKDTLKISGGKMQFDLRVNKGRIKALDITGAKKCRFTFDLRIKGRRDREKILFLDKLKDKE